MLKFRIISHNFKKLNKFHNQHFGTRTNLVLSRLEKLFVTHARKDELTFFVCHHSKSYGVFPIFSSERALRFTKKSQLWGPDNLAPLESRRNIRARAIGTHMLFAVFTTFYWCEIIGAHQLALLPNLRARSELIIGNIHDYSSFSSRGISLSHSGELRGREQVHPRPVKYGGIFLLHVFRNAMFLLSVNPLIFKKGHLLNIPFSLT